MLAVFAIAAGWFGIPGGFPGLGAFLPNFIGNFLVGAHEAESGGFNTTPLLVSVGVSLTGLALGWLVHQGQKSTKADPLKRGLGFIFTAFERKFWVDELYHLILVRPATFLAETITSKWIDQGILDGILHGIGKFGGWLGRTLRRVVDIPVANGVPDGAAAGARWSGTKLRLTQSGRVQQYLVTSLMLVVWPVGHAAGVEWIEEIPEMTWLTNHLVSLILFTPLVTALVLLLIPGRRIGGVALGCADRQPGPVRAGALLPGRASTALRLPGN